ncbi:MAG: SDR family NAD(P)-dependent oxidoreductase [Acidimicrobiales bacterium]|jgi:NAD(P)-dependent dehydrogenase (short-subunit alcohol dehydrogenase family)
MEQLRDKVAVITGGASGIGRAVAGRAAAEGMKLVLADIEEGPLKLTADALTASGAEVEAVVTDVSDGAAVEALRDRALERFGAVHMVHNNAGVGVGGVLWTVSEADWKWILGVNLWGVIHGIRTFVPLLVDQGEGHVVNTASVAGLTSPGFMGPYNATKHAVTTISETLHRDLRAMGSPVGVSVLCPGFVRTGIGESERNRPRSAPAPEADPTAEVFRDVIQQLVAGGIDPGVVAERVIEAVRTDAFYVLTHEDSGPMVATRMNDILEGRSPSDMPIA